MATERERRAIKKLMQVVSEGTWCVCGHDGDGLYVPYEDSLHTRADAERWLREHHREHPEVVAWYIDREENEWDEADCYYDRLEDGSLVEASTRTPFAD